MNAEVVAVLRRENPWLERPETWAEHVARRLPNPFLDRTQPDLRRLETEGLPDRKATLVIGPRQAGKSSWTWQRLRPLGPRILFVDCERPALQRWCADPGRVAEELPQLIERPRAIFFEEAQHLSEAGLFLKGLVDRRFGASIVATGSASFHLLAKTRESLAGRAQRARLFPLSLDEVSAESRTLSPALQASRRRELFARHLIFGGYPAVWLATGPEEELAELVDAFVIRDASDLFSVRRPEVFRLLLSLAARQVGSAVNLSEWASIVGASVPTISTYLSHLQEAHLVVQLPLFAGGKRAELTQAPKVYFVDSGLRNRLLGDFTPFDARADRGPLLENWILSELHKRLPFGTWIGWWRTRGGAEVDFVVRTDAGLVGIEVKASAMKRPALSRSARSFIAAYEPARFLVVNLGIEDQEAVGASEVRWCHPADLGDHI